MQSSFSELEYASKKKQTRRDRFLAEIEAVTPWAFLMNALAPYYPSGGGPGRSPVGLERILRMYVAQQCFGLSDEGTEDAVYDSQAIRRFVGIDLNREAAPDATTLLKFRHLLEEHHLTESIFNAINAHLADRGLFLREGTIVDAQSGFVHTLIGTAAANVHDVTQAHALLHGDETDVLGDVGYQGIEKREENLELPVPGILRCALSSVKHCPKWQRVN